MTVDAEPVELTLRPRTVLLRLLAEPGRRVSIERLATSLWGEEPPANHRNSVARFVADLRRALGPHGERIVTSDGAYVVVVEEGELDEDRVVCWLAQARECSETDLDGAVAAIASAMSAVGVGPNPWLAELADDQVLVRRYDELRIEVLDAFATVMLRAGRHVELVATLEPGVEHHPYNERLWHHLIEAFRRSGRSAEALRACQRLRAQLAEIGLEPDEETRRLEASILTSSSAPVVDIDPVIGAPIGRSGDLRAVDAALVGHRLVSIVGSAGLGKSHLAAAVFRDAEIEGSTVYRVDVRSIRDAVRLVPVVAAAVGAPSALEIDAPDALATHLAPVSCLIILDGCDHLRTSCVDLISSLLSRTAGVAVLVTSRTPLRAEGEFVHRLGPIATCTATVSGPSPAASLFCDRAGTEVDDLGIELDDVESICASLLGHPGAIRVAAALSTVLPLDDLRRRLDERVDTTSSDAMERVLDVAWESLSTPEQNLLARLSVFRGGCTVEAARAVCTDGGESIDRELDTLVERGLVELVDDRLALDEAIRRHAGDRLSDRRESDVVASRLVDWLRDLTARWGIAELGCYAEVGELLLPEEANLGEALSFLHERGRVEELAWLAIRSSGMWINHGRYTEIVRWLGPVADDETVSAAARSAAAALLLEADLTIGRYGTLAAWGERCLELADGEAHDWVPMVAGFLAMWRLMVPMAMTTDELLELAESTADRSDSRRTNQALVLMRRAQVAHHARNHDEAIDLFGQALALVEREGRLLLALEMGETISLYNVGRRADALESVRRWRSGVDTDEWHYQVDIVRSLVVGGCGMPHEATRDLAAALRRHEPISVWARADEFQMAFGLLADMRGEPSLAEELLASPLSGSPFLSSMVIEHIVATRGLGEEGFAAVAHELRSRTIPLADDRGAAADHHGLEAWWTSGTRHAAERAADRSQRRA